MKQTNNKLSEITKVINTQYNEVHDDIPKEITDLLPTNTAISIVISNELCTAYNHLINDDTYDDVTVIGISKINRQLIKNEIEKDIGYLIKDTLDYIFSQIEVIKLSTSDMLRYTVDAINSREENIEK